MNTLRHTLAAIILLAPLLTHGVTISGPSTSTTGSFTLTWPSGYNLDHSDVTWRAVGSLSTSKTYSNLPSGRYSFYLTQCWNIPAIPHWYFICYPNPDSNKTVVVTRDNETAITTTTAAGSTAYTADTTLRGSAAVQIPIRTLPGVNGHAPNLSLSYDSARGTDIEEQMILDDDLGYGWRLNGLSRIHRCRLGIGGSPYPTLDAFDTLCIDGEQLILTSGNFWAANSQYRTENNTQIKVTLKSGDWFEVLHPDGRVVKYGDTATSRVVASGLMTQYGQVAGNSPTIVWGERQSTNGFGDVYTVTYDVVDAYGVIQPKQISYSGATVDFKYGTRSDTNSIEFSVGDDEARVRRTSILHTINIKMNGTKVRDYHLDSNLVGGRMRLERIQECGWSTSGSTRSCFPHMNIEWTTVSGGTSNFPIAISTLTDGLGAKTEYTYASITASSNPINYTEAPFGTLPTVTGITTQSIAAVSEMRKSDGLTTSGRRKWTYRYKPQAYKDDENRGYIGFYEVRNKDEQSGLYTYTQTRLDTPLRGAVSRIRVFSAAFPGGAGTEKYREERAYTVLNQFGFIGKLVYPSSITTWTYEGTSTISASITDYELCFRTLSGDTCPGSGTQYEYPTQRKITTTVGNGLNNPSFTPSFWGDVPDRTITGLQHTNTRTQNLQNTTSPWIRGNVLKEIETNLAAGETSKTATHTFAYKSGTRALTSSTAFSGATGLNVTHARTYTGNNLTTETFSGADFTTRSNSLGSYVSDRYPGTLTNALSQTTTVAWDTRYGTLKTVTDPDSNIQTIIYDNFGRVTSTEAIDGTESTVTYDKCTSGCSAVSGAVAAMKITTSVTNGSTQVAPDQIQYLDLLGRVVLEEEEAFDSADGYRRVRQLYNDESQLIHVSKPYFSTASTPNCATSANCTKFTYDILGRVTREDRRDGGYTTHSFSGSPGELTVTSTEVIKRPGTSSTETRKKVSVFNALGQLIETFDAESTAKEVISTYDYDSLGNLDKVVVDGVTVATMVYDLASNRTSITETNSGTTTIDYDALGQILTQTDAKNQVTDFDFDKLGRLTQRVDRHGTGNAVTNTWNWDATNATGQLASRTNGQFTQSYTYRASDAKMTAISTTINVSGVLNKSFSQTLAYNSAGQFTSITHPNRTISYTYTARGFMDKVKNGTWVMHEWLDTDAYGNSTSEKTHHGGVTTTRSFDTASGRLLSIQTGPSGTPTSVQDLEYKWRSNSTLYQRTDRLDTATASDDLIDTFTYDAMERLTRQATTNGANRQLDFAYNDAGNLTSKTSNVSGDLDVTGYAYGTSGKPHRLTSATIRSISNSFVYDNNGNITRYNATSGDDKFLDYDGQNNLTKITVGTSSSTSTPTARDEYWYDPDGQRFLSRESWDDSGTQRHILTVYLEGYEEITPHAASGYSMMQKYHGSDRTTFTRRTTSGGTVGHKYITYQKDHLGSVDSIWLYGTGVDQKTSHDPFGSRRESDWSADISSSSEALLEQPDMRYSQGFTFHEQRQKTGFVHMNGRVYDPEIGRFVSPDPFVPDPTHSQSYNRYSYVINSPLSLVDPTGFCFAFYVPGLGSGEGSAGECSLSGTITFGGPRRIPGAYSSGVSRSLDEYDLLRTYRANQRNPEFSNNSDVAEDGNSFVNHQNPNQGDQLNDFNGIAIRRSPIGRVVDEVSLTAVHLAGGTGTLIRVASGVNPRSIHRAAEVAMAVADVIDGGALLETENFQRELREGVGSRQQSRIETSVDTARKPRLPTRVRFRQ